MTAYDWLGTIDGDLSNAGNYSPNGTPAAGDTLLIDSAAVGYTTPISSGTCNAGSVTNDNDVIGGGTFNGAVEVRGYNAGQVSAGTFNGAVTNWEIGGNAIGILGGTFNAAVTNYGGISGGTFNGTVTCDGSIGPYECQVSGGTYLGAFIILSNDVAIQGGDYSAVASMKVGNSPTFTTAKGINGSGILGMI